MTNEQIAKHADVLAIKAELFDINSYMEYLKVQYTQVEKQRNEKMDELQSLIKALQEEQTEE